MFLLMDREAIGFISGVSSVLREFPFSLVQSVGDGAVDGLLVADFVD